MLTVADDDRLRRSVGVSSSVLGLPRCSSRGRRIHGVLLWICAPLCVHLTHADDVALRNADWLLANMSISVVDDRPSNRDRNTAEITVIARPVDRKGRGIRNRRFRSVS